MIKLRIHSFQVASTTAVAASLLLAQVAWSQPPIQVIVEELGPLPVLTHLSTPGEQTVDGFLYLLGGLRGVGDPVRAYSEIWKLELATGSWTLEPYSLPYENSNSHHGAAAYYNGHFFASPGFSTGNSGGWGSHNRVIDVDIVAGTAAETVAFPASAIWSIGNVEANGKIYFFGGWTGAPRSHILEYDPLLGTLVQVASMLRPTNEVVPTLGVDGWVYYWGRLHSGAAIERFDPISHQVQAMDTHLPVQMAAHPIYMRWHVPDEGAIYLSEPRATIGGPPSPLYRFSYLDDTLVDTGATVPSEVINLRAVRDENDPYSIYGYLVSNDFWNEPHTLARLRIAPLNSAPVADAGPDQEVVAGNSCLAAIQLDGTGSFDPDGDPLSFVWDSSFGALSGATPLVALAPGVYEITLTVSDSLVSSAPDTVEVLVLDATPPELQSATASPNQLWPPNHKMVPVDVSIAASDACGGPVTCAIASVSSNEPVDGTGDGDTAPDWEIVDADTVLLRAERSGNGSGRIYSIVSACSDQDGNESTAVVQVLVPHNRSK